MENYSDDEKRSSRRRFTSSIMAVFATLPFMSLLSNAQSGAAKRNKNQNKLIHNTPPPIIIDDGSLEIDTEYQLGLVAPSAPYRYTSQFGGTPNISHIKVLDRHGTTIYYEERARGSTLKVQLEDEDGALVDELILTGGSAIEISTRDLRLSEHPNHKPMAFRKHKCAHPGRGNRRFRVRRIQVLGITHRFDGVATSHPEYFSEEYRIMIWLEP